MCKNCEGITELVSEIVCIQPTRDAHYLSWSCYPYDFQGKNIGLTHYRALMFSQLNEILSLSYMKPLCRNMEVARCKSHLKIFLS
jgi:hypothetical protein